MSNIITKSDFAGIIDISSNIRDARFDTYVAEAERLDLRPLMGNAFYYDFVTNITDAKYVTLKNGTNYTNTNNEVVDFKGIKHVIVYFTRFRQLNNDDIFSTPSGPVVKQLEHSEHISERTKARLIAQAKSAAISYWREVEIYLNENSSTYPLFKCAGKKRGSVKIWKTK